MGGQFSVEGNGRAIGRKEDMFMTPMNHHHYGKKEHVNMYLWNRANMVVIVVVVCMPTDKGGGAKKKNTHTHTKKL
jgi:hypothetical protein